MRPSGLCFQRHVTRDDEEWIRALTLHVVVEVGQISLVDVTSLQGNIPTQCDLAHDGELMQTEYLREW